MSWRIIQISSNSKLDLKLGYLVFRNDKITRIFLNEIYLLIIESTAVSITAALLNELIKRKIKIIFCDEKRNPSSELIPYYGSHDSSYKLRSQINWDINFKNELWTEIIKEKIRNQSKVLLKYKLDNVELLESYIKNIKLSDITNREGFAAKVYFNSLFGNEFTRTYPNSINSALNYGYMVMLSCFSREIVANGYNTNLGISHDNIYNHFNLSCDLIEPFRIFIDEKVYEMSPQKFEKEEKIEILKVLNKKVIIQGEKNHLNNAIKIYVRSVFNSLEEKDLSMIKFVEYEV